MPSFSLKDMFLTTTLLAAGIVMISAWGINFYGWQSDVVGIVLLLGGGALIGAGVCVPFKSAPTGAFLGLLLPLFLLLALTVVGD